MKIAGKVIEGKKQGRAIGFPTANIRVAPGVFEGIYAGVVELDSSNRKYKAAVYVSRKNQTILEAHLLSFNGDLYGKKIAVTVGEKIREDAEVQDIEKLKEMIRADIEKIKAIPEPAPVEQKKPQS